MAALWDRRRHLDQASPLESNCGTAERVMRIAAAEALPPLERLSDLCGVRRYLIGYHPLENPARPRVPPGTPLNRCRVISVLCVLDVHSVSRFDTNCGPLSVAHAQN